ncbi:MAG TPA: MOSC N-terminal beta barrel domain-containing protein [Candidatus Dormibacteraeota bacterium]|nr:MOSC N-terminal beta barrel domain-containing protein [Candidatus Dormibacteraeota bacterium]
MGGIVAEIWRYPVKSMRGERLRGTPVTAAGLPGDRRWAHVDGRGFPVTGRRDPRLVATESRRRADFPYEVVEDPAGIFDVAPLLLVNLASLAALARDAGGAIDHRRFRANVYLRGLEPDAERAWIGGRLRLGSALVEAVMPCERCVMITIDPDTAEPAPDLLRVLTVTRANLMGVYCRVLEPGRVALGDLCEPA